MVQSRQVVQQELERLDCRCCGGTAKEGHLYCIQCLKINKNSNIDIYWRRRAAGRCVTCEAPVSDGKARCAECNIYLSSGRAQGYMDAGMCRGCGKAKPAPDGTRCLRCRSKRRGYYHATREQRKADNKCVDCGNAPPYPGRVKCGDCLDKVNFYNASRYQSRKAVSSSVG